MNNISSDYNSVPSSGFNWFYLVPIVGWIAWILNIIFDSSSSNADISDHDVSSEPVEPRKAETVYKRHAERGSSPRRKQARTESPPPQPQKDAKIVNDIKRAAAHIRAEGSKVVKNGSIDHKTVEALRDYIKGWEEGKIDSIYGEEKQELTKAIRRARAQLKVYDMKRATQHIRSQGNQIAMDPSVTAREVQALEDYIQGWRTTTLNTKYADVEQELHDAIREATYQIKLIDKRERVTTLLSSFANALDEKNWNRKNFEKGWKNINTIDDLIHELDDQDPTKKHAENRLRELKTRLRNVQRNDTLQRVITDLVRMRRNLGNLKTESDFQAAYDQLGDLLNEITKLGLIKDIGEAKKRANLLRQALDARYKVKVA